MVETAIEVRFLLFCLKSVTTTSLSDTSLFTTESGVTPATPLIARDANNKVFNIKMVFVNVFVLQRYR